MALSLLARADVDAYVALEFPGHRFPDTFAAAIHTITDGNALFMVDLLRDLRDRGLVVAGRDGWSLVRPVPSLARELPQSIRSVIQRTLERLDPVDRTLLTAASVQGDEFLSGVLAGIVGLDAADVEDRLDRLERAHGLLRRQREQELPDRTLSVRYRFVHVLYKDALYDSLTPGRKRLLSSAIAATLAGHCGERIEDMASEIAELLSVAREFARAADMFLLAAQQALRLFANREAVTLARRGLMMLEAAPELPGRESRELALQTVLGVSLMAVHGFGAAEAERAFRRAHELCQAASNQASLFPILSGQWFYYTIRGELRTAHALAARMLGLARSYPDATLAVHAHQAAGGTAMDLGRLDDAIEHFEEAARLYRRTDVELHALDPGVACGAFAGRVLCLRGYPDRARARVDEAIALARTVQHPPSLAIALGFGAIVYDCRGDIARTLELAEEAVALSHSHGLAQTLMWATVWRGRALVRHGRVAEGIAGMREGLRASVAMGSRISCPQFRALLAEALGDEGQLDEALTLLADALTEIDASGERCWEPEVHRIRGRLLARRSPHAWPEACASVRAALDGARAQNACGWDLRAAVELCLLQPDQPHAAPARATLKRIYDRFTEGFGTADLRAAAALLS